MTLIRFVFSRVAKFACPRVHDDQKMSEDNQNLRSGCPPDYQIFLEKYFENSCPYKFFEFLFLPFPFPTNIYHFALHIIWYQNEGNQKYVEDNQISNFDCPPTTDFRFKFCYPEFSATAIVQVRLWTSLLDQPWACVQVDILFITKIQYRPVIHHMRATTRYHLDRVDFYVILMTRH